MVWFHNAGVVPATTEESPLWQRPVLLFRHLSSSLLSAIKSTKCSLKKNSAFPRRLLKTSSKVSWKQSKKTSQTANSSVLTASAFSKLRIAQLAWAAILKLAKKSRFPLPRRSLSAQRRASRNKSLAIALQRRKRRRSNSSTQHV